MKRGCCMLTCMVVIVFIAVALYLNGLGGLLAAGRHARARALRARSLAAIADAQAQLIT